MPKKSTNKCRQRDDSKETPAKIRNRAKLLDYLSDPENEWPKRHEYSTLILKYRSPNQVYRTLSPQELVIIEVQAMENRKARTIRQRADILNALYLKAMGFERQAVKFFKGSDDKIISQKYMKYFVPSVSAAKEYFDRTEGKLTEKHELFGKHGGPIETTTPEETLRRFAFMLRNKEESSQG